MTRYIDPKRRLDEIDRFCPSLRALPHEEAFPKNLKYPIIIQADDKSDDSDSDEGEVKMDEEEIRFTGRLDKWDKASRSWLSSGTMFFLIVLFHILQVRSDLRKFTTAANTQLQEACSVLEDKTLSLQTALGLAAQDVGPITFKFVRDLKTKIRSAFLFAGQIFGSKVRTALASIFMEYYCLLVAVLVTLMSFKNAMIEIIRMIFDSESFIEGLATTIIEVVNKIMEFIVNPEESFKQMIEMLLDVVFDSLLAIEIPLVNNEKIAHLCSQTGKFNFDGIHNLLRSYLTKMIAITAILLIFYNGFTFIKTIREHEKELQLKKLTVTKPEDFETEDSETDSIISDISEISASSESSEDSDFEADSCLINVGRWIFNFFAYEPFLLFICMGIFGVCHAYLANYLHEQARKIKEDIIDVEIDKLKDTFTELMTDFVVEMETAWRGAFNRLFEPMAAFVDSLSAAFEPILKFAIDIGQGILTFIDFAMGWIRLIVLGDVLSQTVSAVLDCLFLRNFRVWVKIATMIRDYLFGSKWRDFNGGVVQLLKNSIDAVFKKLQVTKFLKKMFSVSFFMFLRLVAKRSVFLYVYLIVCVILISQGILMILIKFILGYF